jgi:hypothetical protein
MQLTWIEFILLCLSTFRLTRLIIFDKITWFMRNPFHEIVEEEVDGAVISFIHVKGSGLQKWIGELLSCYWCSGIWCSILLVLGYTFAPSFFYPIILILAIAGIAGIIEMVLERNE